MDASKTIQQVDQKQEGDFGNLKRIHGMQSIYGQLNTAKRQVNKLLGRFHYSQQKKIFKDQQIKQNLASQKVQISNQSTIHKKQKLIGKYNYYGKKYRFQEKEEELNIQPPTGVKKLYQSQINMQQSKYRPISPRTQKFINKEENQSNIATIQHIDQSVFFDDGQIKMPSKQYYIYFDQPHQSISNSSKQMKKMNRTFQSTQLQGSRQTYNSQKFKPAWLMQKKINSLQKQLKEMKQREKRRYHQQMFDGRKMRNTVDMPIKLKSNIERMVQSLWR